MQLAAIEAEVDPSRFWKLTPRQTWLAIRAYRRRRAWLAWHVAVLSRIDGPALPSVSELAGEPEPDEDEDDSAERQLEITRMWNSVLRGVARAHAEKSDPERTGP